VGPPFAFACGRRQIAGMQDRYFFPLAAAVAGAFIFTAIQPFADRCPSGPLSGGGRNAEDITARDREFCRFVPGNFDGLDIIDTPEGKVLRITRLATEGYEDPRSGPHIVLAADLEYAFESRPVEVTIEARAAADSGASQFQADYFAKNEGESGWLTFDLTPEFKPFTFTFNVPSYIGTEGYDYLAIRPVVPDKKRVMEVRSVRIRAIGPKKAAAPPSAPG
jgi:hypothetical protein